MDIVFTLLLVCILLAPAGIVALVAVTRTWRRLVAERTVISVADALAASASLVIGPILWAVSDRAIDSDVLVRASQALMCAGFATTGAISFHRGDRFGGWLDIIAGVGLLTLLTLA